ncbi:EAL and HDOD domain-containing protein [Acetobacterium wieringae]|uniref:EAL domain-containing protein n=1 Tax=Acetobacterium wieringae TaxID=52694 RepID=A0A5D0WJ33_9FIRM|nr:EAL domain-containing protein [Acetobacterium wieringae]TYC84043.1 EAL domain-containing protein [Acetobacterium wieringae]URN85928.1 EAL domain-containing protein [Acetobacterium wieringae]
MFIARQPIFNVDLDVYGYELLFRLNSQSSQFGGISSQGATAAVLTGLYEAGIENIIENKRAFINFDEIFIHSDALELIKPDQMVVEMLEKIKIDDSLIERIRSIREKGYQIALDDFEEAFKSYPLSPLADIIKYDLMATPLATVARDAAAALAQGKVLLAEKVETRDEFLQACDMGFTLFQGYFFSKPVIAGQSVNKSPTKFQYFRLIEELKKEDPSYDALAELIQQDVTLAYRVMRMASVRSNHDLVSSIRYALTYMGLNEIERWFNILMLQDLGQEKPAELMKIALIRSRFAQTLAKRALMTYNAQHGAAMMGLFSVLDGILDQTMDEALAGIALPPAIPDALIKGEGVLYPIYQLMLAYEKGDWATTLKRSQELKIEEYILYHDYREAIAWANEIILNIA